MLVQRDLGRIFRRLIGVERDNASQGRESALQATRDFFYRGEIAEEMVRFCQEQGGLLAMEDLAEFQAKLEPPAIGSYKGIDVYTCGTWCQGPVSIQALHILEEFDLRGMGHNTAEYLHTLLEALKLAFADRHSYYGDPDFVDVPLEGLLSKAYAAERGGAIDPELACPQMPYAGIRGSIRVLGRPGTGCLIRGRCPVDCRLTPATSVWSISGATPSRPLPATASGRRPSPKDLVSLSRPEAPKAGSTGSSLRDRARQAAPANP